MTSERDNPFHIAQQQFDTAAELRGLCALGLVRMAYPDVMVELVDLLANIAILVLAGFVGFAVISKVPNTLHTPLMSGTNAIHGIVLLGGLIVLGRLRDPSVVDQIVLVVAIAFGTINVIGGFLVTDRMLGMFKGKRPDPRSDDEPR